MGDKPVTASLDKRNYLMDFIKGIAAYGVVLVHFQFPGVPGKVLCSVGVCGVVFFFLISGYYAYDPWLLPVIVIFISTFVSYGLYVCRKAGKKQ